MWTPMTIADFAESERSIGAEIIEVNGFYWRKIRPLFYRALLPYQKYKPEQVSPPPGKLTAYQYAVEDTSTANSNINLMIYDNFSEYSIESLRKHHRRHLRAALKSGMEIKPIRSVEELVDKGYPVYCSFYERSRYDFGKDRLEKENYIRWAEGQISHKGVLVMGVYLHEALLGIYISCRVENTVLLKAAINSEEAIKLRAPELSWHLYREEAKKDPSIELIVDGPYVPADGINAFKFRRGAKAIAVPAMLHLNPAMSLGLKLAMPNAYRMLKGYGSEDMCEQAFDDTEDK